MFKLFKVVAAVTLCSAVPSVVKAEALSARGVVKAVAEATISVDYAARIRKLPRREGQSFKAGDVLIAFDCKRYTAEVGAARATARARELKMSNNRKLLQRGAIGANEVQISEAEFAQAQAEVAALQARTGNCDFKAPYDGLLVERMAHENESPAPNQPLIKIVDMTRVEVEAIIPSIWLRWMKPGQQFQFIIDETGAAVSAEVERMGAVVDPVSQTIKAYGVLKQKNSSVLPGMSGTATFTQAGS